VFAPHPSPDHGVTEPSCRGADNALVNTFLLVYRRFCNPQTLLKLLSHRFDEVEQDLSMGEEQRRWSLIRWASTSDSGVTVADLLGIQVDKCGIGLDSRLPWRFCRSRSAELPQRVVAQSFPSHPPWHAGWRPRLFPRDGRRHTRPGCQLDDSRDYEGIG
jgi:hypothetical protein